MKEANKSDLFTVRFITHNNFNEYDSIYMAIVETTDGQIGFMANHINLLSNLVECTIKLINKNNIERKVKISCGIADFSSNTLSIIVDSYS